MKSKTELFVVTSIILGMIIIASSLTLSASNCEIQDSQPVALASFTHEGHRAALLGDYDTALYSFSCALELESGYADAYYGRAMVYDAMGENTLAIDDLLMALDYSGHFVDPHLYAMIATQYEAAGQFVEASYYLQLSETVT